MKEILFITILLFAISCQAQEKKQPKFTYENFDREILQYQPIKKSGVSDKDFNKGLFRLDETRDAVQNDPKKLTYADYWNITMAFVNFNESNNAIEISFKKAIELDSTNVCTIIKSFGNSTLDIRIPDIFYPFIKSCSKKEKEEIFDAKKYAEKNKLDLSLVTLIAEIHSNDIKFRFEKPVDWSKQTPLDEQNQRLIDSLYSKYHNYLGKSLVGEKLESTMWAVIQHSNLEMMEKYLPVIQMAVKDKELNVVPLKMLIDRVYLKKYNYQIFGSQESSNLADEKTRNEIMKKYGIK